MHHRLKRASHLLSWKTFLLSRCMMVTLGKMVNGNSRDTPNTAYTPCRVEANKTADFGSVPLCVGIGHPVLPLFDLGGGTAAVVKLITPGAGLASLRRPTLPAEAGLCPEYARSTAVPRPLLPKQVNRFKAFVIGGGGIFADMHSPLFVDRFVENLTLPVVVLGVGAK